MKQPSKEKVFLAVVIAIILFMLLTSCVTEKQRLKICNGCPVKTETKETIKIVHDTVPQYLPGKEGPTVYLENPCKLLCDSLGNLKKNVDVNVTKNGISVRVKSQGNGLNIASGTRDTTLKIPVTNTVTAKETTEAHIKYVPCQNERTSFDGFCRWFFYIIAPLLLIYFILKFYFRLPL